MQSKSKKIHIFYFLLHFVGYYLPKPSISTVLLKKIKSKTVTAFQNLILLHKFVDIQPAFI